MASQKLNTIIYLSGLIISFQGCGGMGDEDPYGTDNIALDQASESDLQDFEEESTEDERNEVKKNEAEITDLPEEQEETEFSDDDEFPADQDEPQGEGYLPEEATEIPEEEMEVEQDDSGIVFMPLSDAGDVVSFVEIDRYMGRWYEIATTPSFQQSSCFGTAADYIFNDEKEWVDVTNSCNSGSLTGFLQKIEGRAELDDVETQAKLLVFFYNQAAPYWVVALDGTEGEEQYQWAVVSVPGSQTMWLLSRSKQLDPAQRMAIENHLIDRGFPVDTLIDTPQPE